MPPATAGPEAFGIEQVSNEIGQQTKSPFYFEVKQILQELDVGLDETDDTYLKSPLHESSILDIGKLSSLDLEFQEEEARETAQILKRELAREQMVGSENPVNRLFVKESDIPLDALYNEHLNI